MKNYKEIYTELFKQEPPRGVAIGTSDADILHEARGFLQPFDYSMQLHVGCPCGCLYCYVPSGNMFTPEQIRGRNGELWGYALKNKTRVIEKLTKHIHKGALADKTIYWSGVTDPYAAPPPITRAIWHTLLKAPHHLRPRRIVVQTRLCPDRDVDAISEYAETTHASDAGPAVLFSYSMSTNMNAVIKAWERATPRFEQRMSTISRLLSNGQYVVVTLSPLGPWFEFSSALECFHRIGVAYLTVLFFKCDTRYANTPPKFQNYLHKEMPRLLDPDWQNARLAEARAVFGSDRVLVGQPGFASLTRPHLVYNR